MNAPGPVDSGRHEGLAYSLWMPAAREPRAGVVILETLDLRGVEPGWWTLTCLPLRLAGADGAPARAGLSRPPAGATFEEYGAPYEMS